MWETTGIIMWECLNSALSQAKGPRWSSQVLSARKDHGEEVVACAVGDNKVGRRVGSEEPANSRHLV
jgi:hypothetical protein